MQHNNWEGNSEAVALCLSIIHPVSAPLKHGHLLQSHDAVMSCSRLSQISSKILQILK